MEPVTWGFIGAISGTLIGAGVSILTTIINASNETKLQKNAEIQLRKERARAFQRENLLQLQEGLSLHMRLIAKAYLEDKHSYLEAKNDQRRTSMLSEPLNQELFDSNRRLSILVERVSVEALRKKIYLLRENMAEVLLVRTKAHSDEAYLTAIKEFEPVMQHVGEVLRSSY